ncbi:helix-turn-helix domain-containing protein [Aquimarina aggregata]|uniref:helix-turn-helix domain-containing protein n=1 Tax=Aquimarina aggregata TaxID=1642818 RepID=UPI0024919593|nr:helix-turn-helix transcriptional regulator [Aquimarina aggregata]
MNSLQIKSYRKKHALTQKKLADIAGVSIRAVQSWEQGERNISQSVIKLLNEYESKLFTNSDLKEEFQKQKILENLATDCINNWDHLMNIPLFKARMENEATKLAYEKTPEIIEKFRKEWEKSNSK